MSSISNQQQPHDYWAMLAVAEDVSEEEEFGDQDEFDLEIGQSQLEAQKNEFWSRYTVFQKEGDFAKIYALIDRMKADLQYEISFFEELANWFAAATKPHQYTYLRRLAIAEELMNPEDVFARLAQAWGRLKEGNKEAAQGIASNHTKEELEQAMAYFRRDRPILCKRLAELAPFLKENSEQ
jgi:hypothetical protein